LEARYNILSQTVKSETGEVVLQPKSTVARRMMPQIKINFSTQDSALRGTELQFADGSSMRNDFTNAVLNPKIENKIFAPDIPSDYKVVEPLKR
jgi:outer membrane lipoprotein-sorting protein